MRILAAKSDPTEKLKKNGETPLLPQPLESVPHIKPYARKTG